MSTTFSVSETDTDQNRFSVSATETDTDPIVTYSKLIGIITASISRIFWQLRWSSFKVNLYFYIISFCIAHIH